MPIEVRYDPDPRLIGEVAYGIGAGQRRDELAKILLAQQQAAGRYAAQASAQRYANENRVELMREAAELDRQKREQQIAGQKELMAQRYGLMGGLEGQRQQGRQALQGPRLEQQYSRDQRRRLDRIQREMQRVMLNKNYRDRDKRQVLARLQAQYDTILQSPVTMPGGARGAVSVNPQQGYAVTQDPQGKMGFHPFDPSRGQQGGQQGSQQPAPIQFDAKQATRWASDAHKQIMDDIKREMDSFKQQTVGERDQKRLKNDPAAVQKKQGELMQWFGPGSDYYKQRVQKYIVGQYDSLQAAQQAIAQRQQQQQQQQMEADQAAAADTSGFGPLQGAMEGDIEMARHFARPETLFDHLKMQQIQLGRMFHSTRDPKEQQAIRQQLEAIQARMDEAASQFSGREGVDRSRALTEFQDIEDMMAADPDLAEPPPQGVPDLPFELQEEPTMSPAHMAPELQQELTGLDFERQRVFAQTDRAKEEWLDLLQQSIDAREAGNSRESDELAMLADQARDRYYALDEQGDRMIYEQEGGDPVTPLRTGQAPEEVAASVEAPEATGFMERIMGVAEEGVQGIEQAVETARRKAKEAPTGPSPDQLRKKIAKLEADHERELKKGGPEMKSTPALEKIEQQLRDTRDQLQQSNVNRLVTSIRKAPVAQLGKLRELNRTIDTATGEKRKKALADRRKMLQDMGVIPKEAPAPTPAPKPEPDPVGAAVGVSREFEIDDQVQEYRAHLERLLGPPKHRRHLSADEKNTVKQIRGAIKNLKAEARRLGHKVAAPIKDPGPMTWTQLKDRMVDWVKGPKKNQPGGGFEGMGIAPTGLDEITPDQLQKTISVLESKRRQYQHEALRGKRGGQERLDRADEALRLLRERLRTGDQGGQLDLRVLTD